MELDEIINGKQRYAKAQSEGKYDVSGKLLLARCTKCEKEARLPCLISQVAHCTTPAVIIHIDQDGNGGSRIEQPGFPARRRVGGESAGL